MKSTLDIEFSQFEGLTPDQQRRLSQLLDDYFTDLERGCPPDRDELAARHPDLAAEIAAYIDSLEFLHDAAVGFCPAAEPTAPGGLAITAEKRLGDFEIVREIGRGGMGVVYEARQISLHRRVALKVLPFAALFDSRQIARFRNEAQAAAQLHHPNIVPVYAVGTDRGVHYYAMQLINGQPLDKAVEEIRRATPARADAEPGVDNDAVTSLATDYSSGSPRYFQAVARLGIQAAEALHGAHEYGIVHRDVKPSNLLLDGNGKLWITDFGLARCRADSHLTKTGDFVGTMRYMSPEQTRGDSHLIDYRADIYSLGITLYELLTLRHAVRGDDPANIVRQLDRDEPYRLRLFNANIPTDLENIVQKAISKNRDDRYESAQQLADDLRRFLDGKPTIAKRPSLVDRVGKWARRHKRAVLTAVGALMIALVALAAATLLLAHQKRQTQRALAEARKNFRQYRAQLAFTKNNLALLQNQNGDSRRAEASFKNAIRLQREILAEEPGDEQTLQGLAATLNNLGFLYAKSNPAAAVRCYAQALQTQQRLVDAAPGNVKYQCGLALAHGNLGSAQLNRGKPELAAAAFRASITVLERVRQSDDESGYARDLAISCNNLGMTQNRLGEFAVAESLFRRALGSMGPQIDRVDCTPSDLSSVGGIYNNLAVVLEKQDRYEEAADSYAQAIWFQQMACKRAPDVSRFRDLLSKHYLGQGRVMRSLGRYDEAVAAALARKKIWRGNAPHVWSVAEELARITQETRRSSSATATTHADVERFARQTVAVLDEAVALGLNPAAEISGSPSLLALRDQPEIRAWLADNGQSSLLAGPSNTVAGQTATEQIPK
jgi:serine/threonine protein kinase